MIEFTPTSSDAVPVIVNVCVGMTLVFGPVMFVVGVWSAVPNVSIRWIGLAVVGSLVPLFPNVRE